MSDVTTKLASEALSAGPSRKSFLVGLILTVIPFAAALGMLVLIGGQVREKSAELGAKEAELSNESVRLRQLQSDIREAEARLADTRGKLDQRTLELDKTRDQVAEATTVLADPTAGSATERIERAQTVLAKSSPLGNAYQLWQQGHAAYGKKDYATAERLFTDAVKADSNYAPAYNSLGNLKYIQGSYAEALGWYQRALSLRPSYAPAHYNVGLVYEKLGQSALALRSAEDALTFRPKYPEAEQLKARLTVGSQGEASPRR